MRKLVDHILGLALFTLLSCQGIRRIDHPVARGETVRGTTFYKQAAAYSWQQRDSLFMEYFSRGQVPGFYFSFQAVDIRYLDSMGKKHRIRFYVAPDYAMIGNKEDWARVPLTPMAAQAMADSLDCFLPTRKIVDLIYEASRVKPEPVPMYAYRDSTVTMWQHHLMIEGQRKMRKGLISGIKKDVVIASDSAFKGRANRVAIYGWHKPDGKPIQPLYTGHVNWYVDYSHGIRMIYRKIRVDGKWIDYTDFFKNSLLRAALYDEVGDLIPRY